jgi:hypothetical protein
VICGRHSNAKIPIISHSLPNLPTFNSLPTSLLLLFFEFTTDIIYSPLNIAESCLPNQNNMSTIPPFFFLNKIHYIILNKRIKELGDKNMIFLKKLRNIFLKFGELKP